MTTQEKYNKRIKGRLRKNKVGIHIKKAEIVGYVSGLPQIKRTSNHPIAGKMKGGEYVRCR